MKLVWKYGRLSSISFLRSSIAFHSGIFHIPYQNFRSIPFFIPYHALVVDFILLLLLQHFIPTVVARLKIRKRLILNKLLPLLAYFQHFCFRFQPLSSKCFHFRFHEKLTASSFFHNPATNIIIIISLNYSDNLALLLLQFTTAYCCVAHNRL